MYAAKLLVLLNVPGETFLSKDDIQTSCKQAKDTGLCRQFFPHNAPRRPNAVFWKLKASHFVLLPHRRSPPLPTQRRSSRPSQPVPLTLQWKRRHAARCCPTAVPAFSPQSQDSFRRLLQTAQPQRSGSTGRFTGPGQSAALYRKHSARRTLSHPLQNSAQPYAEKVSGTWALQQYTLRTNQL